MIWPYHFEVQRLILLNKETKWSVEKVQETVLLSGSPWFPNLTIQFILSLSRCDSKCYLCVWLNSCTWFRASPRATPSSPRTRRATARVWAASSPLPPGRRTCTASWSPPCRQDHSCWNSPPSQCSTRWWWWNKEWPKASGVATSAKNGWKRGHRDLSALCMILWLMWFLFPVSLPQQWSN